MSASHRKPVRSPPPDATSGEHFEPHVPGIRYGVLDDLVGYSVRRAQISIYEDFVRSLAAWSFTPQRFSALTVISLNPKLKLTQLAAILGIARSGAVMLVDALAEMGYVQRQPSPDDKRAYGLVMTDKGAQDLAAITATVQAHDARITQRLSTDEVLQLKRLLDRVASHDEDSPIPGGA